VYIDPRKAPPEFLEPLASAYLEDVGEYLQIKQWKQIIWDTEHTLEKIAEASYAEVYRLTETRPIRSEVPETSILKIMRLKSPEDAESLDCEKAIEVSNVVSEFRILNDLTELPGFVIYKAAQLVQGPPAASCVAAWDEYNRLHNGETEFPDPRGCSDRALFLVIELADAGTVLEDYEITTVSEAWDIFLGTIMALTRGEEECQFEVSASTSPVFLSSLT
jgi:serine/threonine-protein kinase haspin